MTGAAHRLGKMFATTLAGEGYAVALHYWKSQDEADRTARELDSIGTPAFPLQADLTEPGSFQRIFDQLDRIPHPLRVLVNSAGAFRGSDPRNTDLKDWDMTMDLNLRAPFFCARKRLPLGWLPVA